MKELSTSGFVSIRVLLDPSEVPQTNADHAQSSFLAAQAIGLNIRNIWAEQSSGNGDEKPVSVTFFERHGWVLHSDFIRNKEDDDYERETVLQRDGKTIALKMPAGPVPKEFAICVEAVDAFGNVYTGRRECVATDESNDRSVQVWVKRNADSVND